MEEKELYAINWDNYLKPDMKRQSGTLASVGWDSRNQFESDLGRVVFCPAFRRMYDNTQVITLTNGNTILI
ncbi:MAG: hypothetical protein K6F74_10680 [Prevotella sp.]|nr:hypothetical protein [Prevotella sp.]